MTAYSLDSAQNIAATLVEHTRNSFASFKSSNTCITASKIDNHKRAAIDYLNNGLVSANDLASSIKIGRGQLSNARTSATEILIALNPNAILPAEQLMDIDVIRKF